MFYACGFPPTTGKKNIPNYSAFSPLFIYIFFFFEKRKSSLSFNPSFTKITHVVEIFPVVLMKYQISFHPLRYISVNANLMVMQNSRSVFFYMIYPENVKLGNTHFGGSATRYIYDLSSRTSQRYFRPLFLMLHLIVCSVIYEKALFCPRFYHVRRFCQTLFHPHKSFCDIFKNSFFSPSRSFVQLFFEKNVECIRITPLKVIKIECGRFFWI